MNADWEQINQYFHQALAANAAERNQILTRLNQENPALGREVASLLSMNEENQSFMEIPALQTSLSPEFDRWQRQIVAERKTPTAAPASIDDRMIGQLLDGKYEIEALCGRGGMGSVYRATHTGTGRRVAVKIIAPELAGDREFLDRFRQEARIIGLLHHPNIVDVTDFGVAGHNGETLAYLVMEYLEGQTLADRLKNRRPMPLDETTAILAQICAAIDEAHRLGILHRDLKPENIWLESNSSPPKVKVLDFGIARLQERLAFDENDLRSEFEDDEFPRQPLSIVEAETLRMNYTVQQLSRYGSVIGTPKYMSPEQCRGERTDKASDIYSLGVIGYQMLDGNPPFLGNIEELLIQHRELEPEPLHEKRRKVSTAVNAVIGRALAKDKELRPPTAGAFAYQLLISANGNEWIQRQVDELYHKRRWKFLALAFRSQWKGFLFSFGLLCLALALPGMPAVPSIVVFGFLWLAILAVTIRGQLSTTAAFSRLVESIDNPAGQEQRVCAILREVRAERRIFTPSTFRNIFSFSREGFSLSPSAVESKLHQLFSSVLLPPFVQRGSETARVCLRDAYKTFQRTIYLPIFRRALTIALVLTALQTVLFYVAVLTNRVLQYRLQDSLRLSVAVRDSFDATTNPFLVLAILSVIVALWFCLRSALEHAIFSVAARRASGDLPFQHSAALAPRSGQGAMTHSWSLAKIYVPVAALTLAVMGLQYSKIPMMKKAVRSYDVQTIKALHISGVPLPSWAKRIYWPGANRPLTLAMAKFQIEKGARIEGKTTLWDWSRRGTTNSIGTPLIAAIQDVGVLQNVSRNPSLETARLFIQHGASVNAQDSKGRTPLMVAASGNSVQAIKLLLESGADINERTHFGSPLLAAAQYQWEKPQYSDKWDESIQERDNAVQFLIKNGAHPNLRDEKGRSALMVMSLEQRANKAIRLTGEALLKAGADINAKDNEGYTPLMYAIRAKNLLAIKFLLASGASLTGQIDLELSKELFSLQKQPNKDFDLDIVKVVDMGKYAQFLDILTKSLDQKMRLLQ